MIVRRALHLFKKVLAACARPSVLGAAYMLVLTVLASRAPIVEEGDRALGAQAREVGTFVATRFGNEIHSLALAIGAAAIGVGLVLGTIAGLLVQLRRVIARRALLRGASLGIRAFGVLVVVHAWLVIDAMARSPQLYADTWYARGGLRRTVQVIATDVLGSRGAMLVGVVLLVAYLAGPPSSWRTWPSRFRSVFARADVRTAAAIVGPVIALAALWPDDHLARASSSLGRPNVIILAADSFRNDRLTTSVAPHLSALAAKGTRFDPAYVSLPRTFPSWVTILTGRHAHHHGIRTMFPRWEDRAKDFDALPERLRKEGYATAVVSDYAGDVFSRIDLGFDRVVVPTFDFKQLVRQRAIERQTPLLPILHSRFGRSLFPVLREMNVAADPRMLEEDAERTLDDVSRSGKPFFMTVFFSTAHFPYAAPSPYYARYTDPNYRGRFKYHKPVGLGGEGELDDADVTQVRALYDGAITSIDDAADQLVRSLDARGLRENTIIVITADHGETLFDNGHGQGHGDHLFGDEGTHVPLVIIDPRHATPRRDGRIVRDVDLAATLYDLTGAAPPRDLDGVSLAPALDGKPTPDERAFAETELWMGEVPALPDELRLPYPALAHLTEVDTDHHDELVLRKDVEAVTTVARHRMIRDARWKLLYVPTRKGVQYMLYDVLADHGETHDVAAEHQDVVTAMRGALWQWMLEDSRMVERGGYLVTRDAPDATDVGSSALRIP
ncbi:MAG TPA: sulfatase [Polyangiaceae bacterium]|nr:sulfatase [Polyangiaceae bacterium]